jgi:uncharacterized membrane protein
MLSLLMSIVSKKNSSLLDKHVKRKIYALGVGSTALIIYKLIKSSKYRNTTKKIIGYLANAGLVSTSVFFLVFFIYSSKSGQSRKSVVNQRN